ncbi:MAG: SH3 domain-containing protein [Planctomycetes bacterium]|nr:SH3 domain-containing protein [Planctomycetota bacterium]
MKHSLLILTLGLSTVLCGTSASAQPHASADPSSGAYVVTAERLNVRSGPNAQATKVGLLSRGDTVEVMRIQGSWASIVFNGKVRFISSRHLLRGTSGGISTTEKTYALSGRDSKRGDYTLEISVRGIKGKGVLVSRVATYSDRRERHTGLGTLQDGEVRVRIEEEIGVVGTLNGASAGVLELQLRLGAKDTIELRERSPRGEGRASGKLKSSTAPSNPGSGSSGSSGTVGKIVQKGRHLIAVAKREVVARIKKEGTKLAYDGVKLEQDFGIGSYFHVGVGGKLEALAPKELSPSQIETSRLQPGHVWLRSNVHGGPRVSLTTSIPIGEFTVGLGFNTGARVDYTVTDIYPLPAGMTDYKTALADLREVGSRSFDLPLDAEEARAMNVGATRVFEGQAHVAVNGSFSIGREVADIQDVLRIGASARVGGFYKISGRARLEVERLPRKRVRVRLSRGKQRQRGVSADLLLGASIDTAALREDLAPAVEYLDEALIDLTKLPASLRERLINEAEDAAIDKAKGIVRKALRFQIKASATKTDDDELDLAYRFDLEREAARKAYERAVRGDFTQAGKLSLDPQSGVVLDHRVVDVETTTYLAASLDLSILSISASRKIRLQDLSVEDESGRTNYEVWRFERDFKLSLLDHKRSKRVEVEVIRKTRPDAIIPANRLSRSLRFRYDVLDPITRKSEAKSFQRLLDSWGLNSGSNLPTPENRGLLVSKYGETRTQIDVQIADAGITQVLRSSRGKLFEAYVKAYTVIEGKAPLWATASGRTTIDNAENEDSDSYDFERRQMEKAKAFARQVQRLANATKSKDRAKALKWIVSSARYDLYTMAALIELAPRSTVTIDASLLGKRIRVVDGVRGGAALSVDDPR